MQRNMIRIWDKIIVSGNANTQVRGEIVKKSCLFLFGLCLLLAGLHPAFGQFETASVLGYVHDASGASVPGAKVSLTNEQTKAVVTAQTNG